MIKTISFIARKPGLSREDFIRHYEEHHAPLALKHFPMFRKYVRNYLVAMPGADEPDFDCITEFWFDDAEGALKVQEILGDYKTEVGRMFLEDEERFQDRGKTRSFLIDERVSDL
jgi:uncharacterized protein (TIGR02118 family)